MALTSSEQAAADAGWKIPEGTEEIRFGDDAIRSNAVLARTGILAEKAARQQATNALTAEVQTKATPAEALGLVRITARIGTTAPAESSITVGTGPQATIAPVLWLDTRQASAWLAVPPTIDNAGKVVVIPADEGATYLLNGSETPAGTHPIDASAGPVNVTIRAIARDGYTLAEPFQWSGVITGGWKLLGRDDLTAGAWETGRTAPGGTWTVTTPEAAVTSAQGLTVTDHGKVTTGKATPATTYKAARFAFTYDLTVPVVGGSAGSLRVHPWIDSPYYGSSSSGGPGIGLTADRDSLIAGKYARATVTSTNLGNEPWASPPAPTGATIPASGDAVIEIAGDDVSVSVNGAVVATGTLAGPVNLRHYYLTLVGGIARLAGFEVEAA